jgi:gliding motility-associated-like protein
MFKKIGFFLFFFLCVSFAYPQCTQSLGVPVINETFGSGTLIYAAPLPAGVTDFKYLTSECPDDGQYAIVNYTTGCYDAWHTLTDHTGDPGGYFLLVNASYQPSTFYTRTINGLCPGTTYQFSAWIVNVDSISLTEQPDVTFTIEKPDGTILGSYDTGQILVTNPYKWAQYGFYFKTQTADSTVVIRMRNNAPGGDGNDLALDDISFTPAGPPTTIKVEGGSIGKPNFLCQNNTVLSSTVGSCYITNAYQWQISADSITWMDIPGAINATYTTSLSVAGTYFYRLNVAENGNIGNVNCRTVSNILQVNKAIDGNFQTQFNTTSANICTGNYTLASGKTVDSAGSYADTLFSKMGCDSVITTVNLTVSAKPNLGKSRVLCFGDTIILNPGLYSQYLWQDNSTGPTFNVSTGGTYSVKVTDAFGCEFSDTVKITPAYCGAIKIPNTFTPNGDGINDTWNIPPLQYFPACTVSIYSRWGQPVFSSIGYPKPWDGTYSGKALPIGTYYYIIDLKNNSKPLSGFITLIR